MKNEFCVCKGWENLKKSHPTLFVKDEVYGWTIQWTELTKTKGLRNAYKYGLSIEYCPMCGLKLKI